jgi:hypothetical protein
MSTPPPISSDGQVEALTPSAISTRVMENLISLIAPSLRPRVEDQLRAVPQHTGSGHRLLAIMYLRGALLALGENIAAAAVKVIPESRAPGGGPPSAGAPCLVWRTLQAAGLLAEHERAFVDATYAFLQALEKEAIRADDASLRTASDVTLSIIHFLATRARSMSLK